MLDNDPLTNGFLIFCGAFTICYVASCISDTIQEFARRPKTTETEPSRDTDAE